LGLYSYKNATHENYLKYLPIQTLSHHLTQLKLRTVSKNTGELGKNGVKKKGRGQRKGTVWVHYESETPVSMSISLDELHGCLLASLVTPWWRRSLSWQRPRTKDTDWLMTRGHLLAACSLLRLVLSAPDSSEYSPETVRQPLLNITAASQIITSQQSYTQDNAYSAVIISSLPNLHMGTSGTPLQYIIVDRLGAFFYWTRVIWQQCAFDNTTPISLINLLGKLGLGLWLDSELHYFSIFHGE